MRYLLSVAAALLMAAPAIAQSAPVDPAKLAVGQRIAAKLMPDGTYAKIMDTMLDPMMANIQDQMLSLSVGELVRAAGVAEKVEMPAATTMRQIVEIIDPAFAERQQILMDALMKGLTKTMVAQEPDYRAGFAEAFARQFQAQELADIDAFFSTKSGSAYAAKSTLLASDPAIMARMQKMMPALMKELPGLLEQATLATAKLPKARTAEDLSAAERAKLAKLLGLSPEDLQ